MYSPELVQVVSEIPSRAFVTAAVWCVPFSGTVGLFNKLQTQKKKTYIYESKVSNMRQNLTYR